jgi:hypothetical protein
MVIVFHNIIGNPKNKTSLHYRDKEFFNEYQQSIVNVGKIVLSYDDDGMVPSKKNNNI